MARSSYDKMTKFILNLNSIAPRNGDSPRVPTVVANGELKDTERVEIYGGEEVADGGESG